MFWLQNRVSIYTIKVIYNDIGYSDISGFMT